MRSLGRGRWGVERRERLTGKRDAHLWLVVIILIGVRLLAVQTVCQVFIRMCLDAEGLCDAEDLEEVGKGGAFCGVRARGVQEVGEGDGGVSMQDGGPVGVGTNPELCVWAGGVDGGVGGVGVHAGHYAVGGDWCYPPRIVLYGRD